MDSEINDLYIKFKLLREQDIAVPSMYELITMDLDELRTVYNTCQEEYIRTDIYTKLKGLRESNPDIPAIYELMMMELSELTS